MRYGSALLVPCWAFSLLGKTEWSQGAQNVPLTPPDMRTVKHFEYIHSRFQSVTEHTIQVFKPRSYSSMCIRSGVGLNCLLFFRIWLWVKDPTDDLTSIFNISRDNVYGAIFLLGLGGAIMLVNSMTMVSILIGEYAVSVLCSGYPRIVWYAWVLSIVGQYLFVYVCTCIWSIWFEFGMHIIIWWCDNGLLKLKCGEHGIPYASILFQWTKWNVTKVYDNTTLCIILFSG